LFKFKESYVFIKRNQQQVWIHTDRDAARAPRKSANVNPRLTSPPQAGTPPVLQARRPIQTSLGRCLAMRLLELPTGPTLQVLVASPNRTTTWFDADKALTQRQANAWARMGF